MLIDDGVNEWYTVFGFWFETMERWAESYEVDTPQAAEEAAQRYAREVKFLHLGVVAVVEGRLHRDITLRDQYATYVDPSVQTQEEMAMVMNDLGLWNLGSNLNKPKKEERKWWQ